MSTIVPRRINFAIAGLKAGKAVGESAISRVQTLVSKTFPKLSPALQEQKLSAGPSVATRPRRALLSQASEPPTGPSARPSKFY